MTMPRRHYVPLVLLAVMVALLFASAAHAAPMNQPAAQYQGLLDLIRNASNQWAAALRGYATRLFWILAAIQLVWTFFPLVLKQADFGEIVGELVRFILVIGFFYALLLNATTWATAIVDSFRQAGAAAAHTGTTLQPGDIFYLAVDLAKTVREGTPGGIMHMPAAIAGAVAAAIILLSFAFIAAFMGLTLIESYVVINASILFMGFGGAQWTREYAIAMARYAVAVGAKLFVLTLIVGLIVTSAHQWQAAYTNDESSMWTLVGLGLVCALLAKQIPDLVQSLITGTSTGGGGAIGAMAAAGVAAAAAGAAVATGGVSAAAGAAANGLGNLAGGMGGGSGGGGGGLAGMIQSSISGGAGRAASAATGGPSGGANALSPRVGGASGPSASGSASSAGRGAMGGGSGPASAPSQPSGPASGPAAPQEASAGDGGAGQGEAASGAESASPAASGGSGGLEPGGTTESPGNAPSTPSGGAGSGRAGKAAHMATAGVVRTAGLLSAISVPGMEGAAGLSIGPHASQFGGGAPSGGGAGDQSGDFASSDEGNTIRPATPSTPPASSGTPPAPPPDDGGTA